MQAIGNALTIFGILVTFLGYFGKHSGVTLADLEPGLVARWHRARTWIAVKLGRSKSANVNVGAMFASTGVLTATAMAWSPLQPSDDIAVRVDKLTRNLDSLRASNDELRAKDQERVREMDVRISDRVSALEHEWASQQERERLVSTWAMKWEVRGLLLTLLGAALGILGQ